MYKNNMIVHILLQTILAIAYVAFVRKLIAIDFQVWGQSTTGIILVLRMLLDVTASLAVALILNYIIIRSHFYRLGLFAGLAVFFYYYIYNPYGHNYLLVYLSILRSPPHLINMMLLVVVPSLIGRFLDTRIKPLSAH